MSPQDLDAEHGTPLRVALNNLLSTPVAEFTYAQMIDGMPVNTVYAEDHWFREDFPVIQHDKLCPGTLEKTRAFRSDFDYSSLSLDSEVSKCSLSMPPHCCMCILWFWINQITGSPSIPKRSPWLCAVEASASGAGCNELS